MKKHIEQAAKFLFTALVYLVISFPLAFAQQGNAVKSGPTMDGESPLPYVIPQKAEDISPLLNGEKIPSVTLRDSSGDSFDLNQAVASKPTILIFYRGGWCPFCSKQLSGLQQIAPELEKEGFQLIAISTDQPEGLKHTATSEKLNYTLLSDADLNVSKQFGLAFKAPEGYWDMLPKTTGGKNVDLLLPVPAVFILDKNGVIRFEHINPDFKQRLNPDVLMAVSRSILNEL
ncbi:peroxiredoxin-like family protein [Algoriphagus resistens]|uniref:peroxiredoxin-like family protein n=1 Tax=Algoriphagus resistens TaxID=1750590 RepID=UPI000716AC4F|nr:peroxiredoxin-like family protein [Algoriphagus resistens]